MVPLIDVFQEVKDRLTMEQVVRNYGYEPTRAGFIRCPFHQGDRTASLKLYPNSWFCFSCGRGGSVIDFAAELFHLDPLGAVRQLDRDFNLGLPLDRQQTPEEHREAAQEAQRRRELTNTFNLFEEWRTDLIRKASEAYRASHEILLIPETPGDMARMTEQEATAVKWQPYFEYLIDALMISEPEEVLELFKMREEVEQCVSQTLNALQEKSKAS